MRLPGDAGPPVELHLPGLSHPVHVRPGTPDAGMFFQAVVREAFSRHHPAGPIRCIVDAGANVGDAAVWYLARYPAATLVAVEPDPDNVALLRQNLAPWGASSD